MASSMRQRIAATAIAEGPAAPGPHCRPPTKAVPKAAAPRLVDPSRRQLLAAGGLGGLCSCCSPAPATAAAAAAPATEWSYACSAAGPTSWAGPCRADGAGQSPIDIPLAELAAEPLASSALSLAGYAGGGPLADATCVNPGHGTMQVLVPEGAAHLELGGVRYDLLQYHFHVPSEHSLGGRHAAMEAHLVHRDPAAGGIVVLAALLQPPRGSGGSGRPNPCLQAALHAAPAPRAAAAPLPGSVWPRNLLPPLGAGGAPPAHVQYGGSLTTPPCSGGVRWVVFTRPVEVAAAQVLDFMVFAGEGSTFGSNARPEQPRGDRVLRLFA